VLVLAIKKPVVNEYHDDEGDYAIYVYRLLSALTENHLVSMNEVGTNMLRL
jgi:hypothetical protein